MVYNYIDPVAFNLLSRPVYWYGIIVSIAIFLSYYYTELESRKLGFKKDTMLDLLFIAIPVAFIFARMYYVVFRWDYYSNNKNKIIAIWDGGIAIYGGLIGGFLALYYFSKKRNLNLIKMLDIIAPSLLIGQAIGRWGNFFNHEAYGSVVSKNFLIDKNIPGFIIENMYIDGNYRQPTFLYESIWCFIALIIILLVRKYLYSGEVLASYLFLYGIERFVVEGMRADSLYIGYFRVSQIVSILIVLIAILIFIKTRIISKQKIKYIES